MRCAGVWRTLFVLAMLAMLAAGCLPATNSRLDEQKDPSFLAGLSRYQEGSYDAAVEAFEKALEANPRSASAHYQLGLVYYENLRKWPEAIYHFQRHLDLDPRSTRADVARASIASSKQMIAREFPLAGLNVQTQQELAKVEGLTRENALLKQQIAELKARLAEFLTNPPVAITSPSAPPVRAMDPPSSPSSPVTPTNALGMARLGPSVDYARVSAVASTRTHTVRQGETPYAIARRYGVSLQSLLAANPGLNARQLRVNQTIHLPAR